MATTNTIEYAFPLATASVATATARDFTQIAGLYIGESSTRTFKSVFLEVSGVDNGAAAGSITAILIGVALGAVARSDATVTFTLNNSGENQTFLATRDVTSYFVTNYTGTTMTADCRLTVTGRATQNCTAKLIITYEYDETANSTRTKTVRIPVDSNTGNLTTSFVNVGGVASQIPRLDYFCPEPTKTFRDIFFQADVHSGTTAAASAQLDLSYDGGTSTVSDLAWGFSLNSDVGYRRIDNLLATLATNATGSLQAKTTSTTGAPYPCFGGVLVVTYSYDHSATTTTLTEDLDNSETGVDVTAASNLGTAPYVIAVDSEQMLVTSVATNTLTVTRGYNGTTAAAHSNAATVSPCILNSLVVGCASERTYVGGTATGDKARYQTEILVPEPTPCALVQSAIAFFAIGSGAVTLDMRCGSQASRTFAHAAAARCGGNWIGMRRIDSGAAGGTVGLTFARGYNTLTLDVFDASATLGSLGSLASGVCYLNYVSAKHTSGAHKHTQTRHWVNRPFATGGAVPRLQSTTAITPVIPESSYYLTSVTYRAYLHTSGTTNPTAIGMAAELQSGEAAEAGWCSLGSWLYQSDAEIGYTHLHAVATAHFNRYPGDPADQMDIETSRDYRFDAVIGSGGDGAVWQAACLLTYHTITDGTKTGTVSAYADADGAGLTVRYYRSDTWAYLGTSTTTSGGAHSFTWYDDTVNVYATCLEDSTHTGASWTG